MTAYESPRCASLIVGLTPIVQFMRAVPLLAALLALAACGEGDALDNEIRNIYREELVTACVETDWAAEGLTRNEVAETCGCASRRWMKDNSTRELLTREKVEEYPEIVDRCAGEARQR